MSAIASQAQGRCQYALNRAMQQPRLGLSTLDPQTPSRVNNASAGHSSDSQSPIIPPALLPAQTSWGNQSRCPSNQ